MRWVSSVPVTRSAGSAKYCLARPSTMNIDSAKRSPKASCQCAFSAMYCGRESNDSAGRSGGTMTRTPPVASTQPVDTRKPPITGYGT